MSEEWRPIKGYKYYEVSNKGRIRSWYNNRFGKLKNPKIKNIQIATSGGYSIIQLYKNKREKNYFVHRLVAEAFIPNPNNKPLVNHIDGDKNNNNINNLEWVTDSENKLHAYKIGLREVRNMKGEKHPSNKLSQKDVLEIREMCKKSNLPLRKIARRYNVSRGTISNIKNRHTWKHV